MAALIDRLIGKGKLIAIDGDQIAERQLSEDELIAASRDLLSAAPLPDWTIGEYGQLEVGAHLRKAVAHLRDAAAVMAETTGASAEASAFGGSSPQ